VYPAGVRVPRFYCPVAVSTISLLPMFLASRMSTTLEELQEVLEVVETAPSLAAAAEVLRPADAPAAVTSISAVRWVRRRVKLLRAALLALVTLLPELVGCMPTLSALRAHLGVDRVLVALRELARRHIYALSPPLGLSARGRR
jgi:hypothetical protein